LYSTIGLSGSFSILVRWNLVVGCWGDILITREAQSMAERDEKREKIGKRFRGAE
jgi:hypothetical protein